MVAEISGIRKTLLSKLKLKPSAIAEMERGNASDLAEKRIVHVKKISDGKIRAFIVKGYEHAILIQMGKTIGDLPEGVYEIEKKFQHAGSEIIWVDKTEFITYWGMPEILLADDVIIGARGSLKVKISDAKKFVMNVVSGKQKVEREQVDDFILTEVIQAYQEIFQDYTVDDIRRRKKEITQKVQAELYDILTHWGIEVITLNIEGFKLPEELEVYYKEQAALTGAAKVRTTKVAHRKAEIADEAEMAALETRLATLKKSGSMDAEMEIMEKKIQMMKYKKALAAENKDLERIETDYGRSEEVLDAIAGYDVKKYAEAGKSLGSNTVLDHREREKNIDYKYFDKETDKDIALSRIDADKDVGVAKASSGLKLDKQAQRKAKKRKYKQEISELKAKIGNFDDMLSSGKIAEDTYKMRINQFEKRLERLENKLDSL